MKLSELLEDVTIPQLNQYIRQGFPHTKKRQHATYEVKINKLQYEPILDQDVLRVVSSTRSDNGNEHNQMLELRGINFQSSNVGHNREIIDINGHPHSITPVPLNISTVGVRCDCEDYMMRFANFNIQQNCHLGPPPPRYVRTTDRPEVNPHHVPGMCKHIIRVVDDLRGKGILI